MAVSAPTEVAAGETFDLTIQSIGVAVGPSEDPPDARVATYFVTGGATPSGKAVVGSITEPAQWPVHVSLTATGQPGEKIEIGVVDAEQIIGPIPGGSLLRCSVGDGAGQVATVQITD